MTVVYFMLGIAAALNAMACWMLWANRRDKRRADELFSNRDSWGGQ
jgi:hypothetical protein